MGLHPLEGLSWSSDRQKRLSEAIAQALQGAYSGLLNSTILAELISEAKKVAQGLGETSSEGLAWNERLRSIFSEANEDIRMKRLPQIFFLLGLEPRPETEIESEDRRFKKRLQAIREVLSTVDNGPKESG